MPQISANSRKGEHMAVERTLSIIKPDATARNITGKIISKFEDAGLRIVAQKRVPSNDKTWPRSMPCTNSAPSSPIS